MGREGTRGASSRKKSPRKAAQNEPSVEDATTTTEDNTANKNDAATTKPPEESQQHHPLARVVEGMNRRSLLTGMYGARGERIRHVVANGALSLPQGALDLMAQFEDTATEGADKSSSSNTKSSKAKSKKRKAQVPLPGLDSVIRPTMDKQNLQKIAVTDIFHKAFVNPSDPALPPVMRTVAMNRTVDLLAVAVVGGASSNRSGSGDGTERIRGGGDEGGDEATMADATTASAENPSTAAAGTSNPATTTTAPTTTPADAATTTAPATTTDAPAETAPAAQSEAPAATSAEAPAPTSAATAQSTNPAASASAPVAAPAASATVPQPASAATSTPAVAATATTTPATAATTSTPAPAPTPAAAPSTAIAPASSTAAAPTLAPPTTPTPTPATSSSAAPAPAPVTTPTASAARRSSLLTPLAAATDKVIELDTKAPPQWEQHVPAANDENLTDPEAKTPKPDWFDPSKVSNLERTLLPEWFDESASHRTEETYLKARSTMMHISDKLGNRFVTSTLARRSLPGDVGSLHRLHSFLTHYLWINEDGRNDSAPTPASLQAPPQLTKQSVWTEKRRGDLIHAVVEVSQQHQQPTKKQKTGKDEGVGDDDAMEVDTVEQDDAADDNTFLPINWEEIAEKVGASAGECEREFLAMPLDGTAAVGGAASGVDRSITPEPPTITSSSSANKPKDLAQEEFLRSLVEESSPDVIKAVTEAALRVSSQDLPGAQRAARLGLVASQAVKAAQGHEETVSRLLSEVVDQRMKKLECRMALMDDLEGMLEAERVALELERRDLYTTRCRDWFGGG